MKFHILLCVYSIPCLVDAYTSPVVLDSACAAEHALAEDVFLAEQRALELIQKKSVVKQFGGANRTGGGLAGGLAGPEGKVDLASRSSKHLLSGKPGKAKASKNKAPKKIQSNVLPCLLQKVLRTSLCMSIMFLSFFLVSWRSLPPQDLANSRSEMTATSNSHSRKVSLRSINGLRVVITLLIVYFHAKQWMTGAPLWLRHCAEAFMQFFFITSGFVSYLGEFRDDKSFGFRESVLFALKRFSRLCPEYYAAILLSIVLSPTCHKRLDDAIYLVFFAQTYWPGPTWWPLATGWFVSTLMLLSAGFPLLYNMFPNGKGSTTALLGCVIVARSLIEWSFSPQAGSFAWYTSPAVRVFEYAAGMLAAKICSQFDGSYFLWKLWGIIFDCSIAGAILILSLVKFPTHQRDFYLTPVVCMLCISSFAVEQQIQKSAGFSLKWIIGGGLSNNFLQLLSAHMYATFMLTLPLLKLFDLIVKPSQLPSELCCWVLMPVCVCAGMLFTRFVHEPVARLLSSNLKSKS